MTVGKYYNTSLDIRLVVVCGVSTDKGTLTCYSDVISGHHCGLSGSVMQQGEFSEIFSRLELIHLAGRGRQLNRETFRLGTLHDLPLSPRRLFA